MDIFLKIIPIIISSIALFVSFMTYKNERNNVISKVVSTDRIKWISDVRSLMSSFLESYIKGANNIELKIIKSKIDLYIIFDKDVYKDFENKLNCCIENPYTDNNYKKLVIATQEMLNTVWVRAKTETGITASDERRISNILNR